MSPIAPPGTLAASSSVLVAVLPHEGASIAPAGTVVYLVFSAAPGGGIASVGATALTATPTPSVTPSSGEVVVTTVPRLCGREWLFVAATTHPAPTPTRLREAVATSGLLAIGWLSAIDSGVPSRRSGARSAPKWFDSVGR